MGNENQDDQVELSVRKSLLELKRFARTASNQTLGDLQLNRLNHAANAGTDFQQAADVLMRQCVKIIQMANDWAQSEAEARYVTFLRESELLRRSDDALEVEAEEEVKKRQKRLLESE